MNYSKIFGGMLFVCGTSIGTGILGIPSETADCGFSNSLILFIICWIFSGLAALYYLEAHMWQKSADSNLLSMSNKFFGKGVKVFTLVVFLSILYSLLCTYLLAGASWFIQLTNNYLSLEINHTFGMLLFVLFMGTFVYFGTQAVDKINRLMTLGLVVCYVLMLCASIPKIEINFLIEPGSTSAMPFTLPLLTTAFGYSIIIPSLNKYFNKQAKMLQTAVILGSLLTLAIYVLWQASTVGNLGLIKLQEIGASADNGTMVMNALIHNTNNEFLKIIFKLFAIFAVITSFLGVSMALYHFLADSLGMPDYKYLGILLLVLTYAPPMVFLHLFPTGFNQILAVAGMLVAILLGILPVAMVYKGRYLDSSIRQSSAYTVIGGRILLILTGAFFCYVVLMELIY